MVLPLVVIQHSIRTLTIMSIVGTLAACSKSDSFKSLEEKSILLSGQAAGLEVLNWSPEAESVTIPAKGSLILGITLRYSGTEKINYRYLIDGVEVGQGSEAYYSLKGTQLGEKASTFTLEASSGTSKASHDFTVIKNKLPLVSNQSPVESLAPIDCSQSSKIFSAEFQDPENSPLQYNWFLDGQAIDDTILTDVKGARARAVVSYDCSKTVDNTLSLVVSDGIDEETVSWRYVKQVSADTGTVGNSAIAFNPVSYEFGPLAVFAESSTVPLALTNTALKPVYFTSFTGENTHFSVVSSNCPLSPSPWASGANCTVNVKFSPKGPGSQSMSLTANYKADPDGSNLISTMGITGLGVSPLNFAGVASVSDVRHNKMTLHWPSTPTASSFIVFRVSGSDLVFQKTLVNTAGTITSTTVTGLTPGTSYTFRVRATDIFGNQDANTADVTRSTAANAAPAITILNVASYNFYSGNSVGPLDANDATTTADVDSDDDALTYSCTYNNISDASGNLPCTTLVNEGGGSPSFNTATGVFSGWKPLHSNIGDSIRIDFTATDPYSASSTYPITRTVIQGVPNVPVVTGISSVRANTRTQTVSGTADANGTVVLYYGANCATQLTQGTANGAGSFSIAVTFPASDAAYTVRAKGLNVIGNYSDCSATSSTFTLDMTAPTPLTLTTTPTSPNGHLTPILNITTEANATLDIYTSTGCGSPLSPTSRFTADANGLASVPLTVAPYASVTYYVVASDDLGNVTACNTKSINYTANLGASGVGYFTGTQTTEVNGFNGTTYNGSYFSSKSPFSVKWSNSYYDSDYFSHSAGLPEDVDIETSGYYRISANMPFTLDNAGVGASGNAFASTGAQLYVNNSAHEYAMTQSSLITNNDAQQESSANFSTIVYLTAGQTINLRVFAVSGDGLFCDDIAIYPTPPTNPCAQDELVQISSGQVAQLSLEFINSTGTDLFIAKGSSNTDGGSPTNINLGSTSAPSSAAMKWTESVVTSASFLHNAAGASPEQVTIQSAGDYLAYVSIPFFSSTGGNRSPKLEITKNGTPISTGSARQGFVLGSATRYNSRSSSLHWSGLIPGLAATDVLRVSVGADAASGTSTIVAPLKAALALQKQVTSTKVFQAQATATSGSSGTWNPQTNASILWATGVYTEAAVYGHDTVTNSHQVTLKQAGDYVVIYRDTLFLDSAVNGFSINPIVSLLLNGSTVQGAQLKNHFIYNNVGNITNGINVPADNNGHRRTSGSMMFYLRNVNANDVLSFNVVAESSFFSPTFTGSNNNDPCNNRGNSCTYDGTSKIYTYTSSVTALNPATLTIIKK